MSSDFENEFPIAIPYEPRATPSTSLGLIPWPPPPRATIPAMPPGTYDHEFPWYVPLDRDIDFYRGDFGGVTVPGIPILPGQAGYTEPGWRDNLVGGKNPPIMAADIPRYWMTSRELSTQILTQHALNGYTHMQCCPGAALECGMSIDQYIEYTHDVKSIVGWADHWFLGWGPWSGGRAGAWTEHRDRDRDHWASLCDPWIDALLANAAIDLACVGWQLDAYNTADPSSKYHNPFLSIVQYFADRLKPSGIKIGTHWITESGAWNRVWFPDDQGGGEWRVDRYRWWQEDVKGLVDLFHHQGDVNMSIPEYQAKLVDSLALLGNGHCGDAQLVVYEYAAQAQFNLYMSEAEGNARGYYLTCTKGPRWQDRIAPRGDRIGGYGGGARVPQTGAAF